MRCGLRRCAVVVGCLLALAQVGFVYLWLRQPREPRSYVKKIHQQYKTDDPAQYPYLTWVAFQSRWKEMHPGWEHRMWTDPEEREVIAEVLPEMLPVYDSLNKSCSDISFIMRADIASHSLVYAFGGVYADMDSVPIRPLDEMLESEARHVQVLLPARPDGYFVDNDLLIAMRERHPFFRDCLLSVKYFVERQRDFACSFEPPPRGQNHPLEPYFPLLWFAASRRLLMCNAAWRGEARGMNFKKIERWERQLEQASSLLGSDYGAADRLYEDVSDKIKLSKWHHASDVRLPAVVGTGVGSKARAERRCAGPEAHVLDGARADVVRCMAELAEQQVRNASYAWIRRKLHFVLLQRQDSSWEGSGRARAQKRNAKQLAELRNRVPGFLATLGACGAAGSDRAPDGPKPPLPRLGRNCAKPTDTCGFITGCAWCKKGSDQNPEDQTNCLSCLEGFKFDGYGDGFGDCTGPCVPLPAPALAQRQMSASPRGNAGMDECRSLCLAEAGCAAFDLPVLEDGVDPAPQAPCRLFGPGPHIGVAGPPRLCFVRERPGPPT